MCSILVMEKFILNLTPVERASLTELLKKHRLSALRRQRASIMLKADEGLADIEIAEELDVSVSTVERVRKRAVFEGVVEALERRKQTAPSRPRALDGRGEAELVRIACSEPPEGQARWTLSLLAGKLIELEVVDAVSRTTVHRMLKKTASSRGK